jgi:hypothetical protein
MGAWQPAASHGLPSLGTPLVELIRCLAIRLEHPNRHSQLTPLAGQVGKLSL